MYAKSTRSSARSRKNGARSATIKLRALVLCERPLTLEKLIIFCQTIPFTIKGIYIQDGYQRKSFKEGAFYEIKFFCIFFYCYKNSFTISRMYPLSYKLRGKF